MKIVLENFFVTSYFLPFSFEAKKDSTANTLAYFVTLMAKKKSMKTSSAAPTF
jgi:hypothetical protein